MMKSLSSCKIGQTANRFKKTEQGKTFSLELSNNGNFYCEIVDIDKCVFEKVKLKRCDWLFLVPKSSSVNTSLNLPGSKAYYIELKGLALYDAYEQLFNAIENTKHEIPNFDIVAMVISIKGRQPEIENCTAYKRVKQMIRKEIIVCKVHKGNHFTHTEKI
ncbi:MAG TPA: hypothetical protein VGS79_26030 [Puia sp.]|nr:hypothetical protein [Puia sp.]